MSDYSKITEYLNRCIESDHSSHAYIFYGPDEISKKEIALWFAHKILKNETMAKFHPDLFLIKPETDENITINLIREFKKFLVLTPYSSNRKVVIIEMAEKLNTYAQNAMLKIFEEAPSYAVIIICTKTLDSLLETIVSRGLKLSFWQTKKDSLLPDKKNIEVFNQIFNASFFNKYNYLENINALKPAEFFRLWINFLREKLLENPTKELFNLVKISQNIYFKLNESNINSKFAYDELILSLRNTN